MFVLAVFYGGDTEIVRLSREHNNANILSIGARFVSQEEALRVIQIWLASHFQGTNDTREGIKN